MRIRRKKTFRSAMVALLLVATTIGTTGFVSSDFQISKNLEIFAKLLQNLHKNYVDEIKTGKLIKTGIDAMLETLDPYTVYIPESKVEDYKLMTTGEYGGIGSTIQQRGNYVQVAQVYRGFPADKAGIISGDKIIKVDDKDVKGKNTEEVSNLLKGQAGTELNVTVNRPGAENPLTFTIKREKVKIDNIPYSGMLKPGIGYIKLTDFTQDAGSDVREEYVKMRENNDMKGIIIDLRNNGGGLLREAVKIVNIFVPAGQMVVETRGKLEAKNRVYRTQKEPVDTNVSVVVLVNGNSASASEIVAGAIQDLDRGVIMGTTTYGKGLVQNIIPLSYNARMKVTVAKYYIPSGRCIQSIDYSNDKNGKAQEIPDSLKEKYTTHAGRVVYDGAGIYPDKKVKPNPVKQITKSLLRKHLIFDYITNFYLKHDSIAPAQDYSVTDETYEDFKDFLNNKNFSYKTKTEKRLNQLRKTAEKEEYMQAIADEIQMLEKELHHDKSKDLEDFRPEIQKQLRTRIAGRYYYRKGRVLSLLKDDKQTQQAISLLNDSNQYRNILKPEN